MSEHLTPPSVNDDAGATAERPCVDAAPEPAEAANGMTQAASTPINGISTERRIVTPLLALCTPSPTKDRKNRCRIRFDIRTIRTCLWPA